jgi:hypothetical protein
MDINATEDTQEELEGIQISQIRAGRGPGLKGKELEEKVGLQGPKRRVESALEKEGYRYPDGYDEATGTLSEAKNVAYQGYTKQLRDYVAIAERENMNFVLYITESTVLSAPLQIALAEAEEVALGEGIKALVLLASI